MITYEDKQALVSEIKTRAGLFTDEFADLDDRDKDVLVDGVDRTPAQMIAYQLGWMNLILGWEERERDGQTVSMPTADHRWNDLGPLYQDFYARYEGYPLVQLRTMFDETVQRIVNLVEGYTDDELFQPGGRAWASSTPANWPIWKWIHINTVAPFKTFRTKIRRWKKLQAEEAR